MHLLKPIADIEMDKELPEDPNDPFYSEMVIEILLEVRSQHEDFLEQVDVLLVGAIAHPFDQDGAWARVHAFIEEYRRRLDQERNSDLN